MNKLCMKCISARRETVHIMVQWFPRLLPCKLCDPKDYAAAKAKEPPPGATIKFRKITKLAELDALYN